MFKKVPLETSEGKLKFHDGHLKSEISENFTLKGLNFSSGR